jgi:putative phage-type endonuclease
MKRVTLNQGSEQWKAWRREGIGGSDIVAILGLSPYDDHTREVVFREKVHRIEREGNFAMHRGQRLEPHARYAYERRQRCSAPPACVEADGTPWARVSLDGLCHDGAAINRQWWILELKCPNWQTHDLALNGIVPEHFEVQCQWQMLVAGLDRLDFASFNPGSRFTPDGAMPWEQWHQIPEASRPPMPEAWLAVQALAPDEDRQAWILEEAARFWDEVLEARAGVGAVAQEA